jgi:hypothetical protein
VKNARVLLREKKEEREREREREGCQIQKRRGGKVCGVVSSAAARRMHGATFLVKRVMPRISQGKELCCICIWQAGITNPIDLLQRWRDCKTLEAKAASAIFYTLSITSILGHMHGAVNVCKKNN